MTIIKSDSNKKIFYFTKLADSERKSYTVQYRVPGSFN